jgi:hypothetical protein
VFFLVIYYIGHVDYLVVIISFKSFEVQIIIIELIHLVNNSLLNIFYFFILPSQQVRKMSLTCFFIFIHNTLKLREMLFHLVLDNLSVTLLDPLKVSLGLSKLVPAVEYKCFCALDLLFYISHNLWYYIYLVRC